MVSDPEQRRPTGEPSTAAAASSFVLSDSFQFPDFLPATFGVHRFPSCGRARSQTVFLFVASDVSCGTRDWRLPSQIPGSSLVDHVVARGLAASASRRARRWLLAASLGANLGCLGTFKYFDFFATSLAEAAASMGWTLDLRTCRVIGSWLSVDLVGGLRRNWTGDR